MFHVTFSYFQRCVEVSPTSYDIKDLGDHVFLIFLPFATHNQLVLKLQPPWGEERKWDKSKMMVVMT